MPVTEKPEHPLKTGADVVARCESLGFAIAGAVDARRTEFEDALRTWLGEGGHATMSWLANNTELRVDPSNMVEGAQSILLVADMYAKRAHDETPPGHARVAKYARGDDYHRVMKSRLHTLCDELTEAHQGETFRAFVDTAPVLEREHAARAGIGWPGKHTLTINPAMGSYLFLGGVLSTKRFTPCARTDRWDPVANVPTTGHCGTCTRCIDACPTDAITPWSVDARKCISYLTIERREPIDTQYWRAIGDNLYGCDICQDVCPHNQELPSEASIRDEYTPRNTSFNLLEVLGWTEDDRRAAFTRSAMKRAKLPMMKRNAIICAFNAIESGQGNAPELRATIASLATDEREDELTRETAHTAMRLLH